MSDWGFADMYDMSEPASGDLPAVRGDDWRNILVLGRATEDGVYPETLALVGRARSLADDLGCRVEVLLIGEHLDAATEALKTFPIDHVYRVEAPDYAPIDHAARILEGVVKARRPELVMVFQSRTGDAITAYAAHRLGVGFVIGCNAVEMDTMERRAVVTHVAGNAKFQTVSTLGSLPQFISVQRGMYRAPMEDPYAQVRVFDLDIDAGTPAPIEVIERHPPEELALAVAERVVVAGALIQSEAEVTLARDVAKKLGARFGVGRSLADRGLAREDEVVGGLDQHVRPKLLVAVGVRGTLDFLEGIDGEPTICVLGGAATDPLAKRATFLVPGDVTEAAQAFLDALS